MIRHHGLRWWPSGEEHIAQGNEKNEYDYTVLAVCWLLLTMMMMATREQRSPPCLRFGLNVNETQQRSNQSKDNWLHVSLGVSTRHQGQSLNRVLTARAVWITAERERFPLHTLDVKELGIEVDYKQLAQARCPFSPRWHSPLNSRCSAGELNRQSQNASRGGKRFRERYFSSPVHLGCCFTILLFIKQKQSEKSLRSLIPRRPRSLDSPL